MKIQILNLDGKKKSGMETNIFDNEIREDILQKAIEQEKQKQPYAPFYRAGKQAAAAGKTKHGRRQWKSAAGRGISRVPRKVFFRRGSQFVWQAAGIPSTVGGFRAHPPKTKSMIKKIKINKKEKQKAFFSALALTAYVDKVKQRYKSIQDKNIKIELPLVVDNKVLDLKTKDFLITLKKILNDFYSVSLKNKKVRAGKGKSRGRKYKKYGGFLLVVGNKQEKKVNKIDVKKVNSLKISDLSSVNGPRIVIYTEQAIKDLENKLGGKNDKTNNK
jgi:large subunit ribosomal protein L4e